MGYKGCSANLTLDQARQLLSCVVNVQVLGLQKVAFTNDVFRVATNGGNYYVKFHTARWYLDMEDTAAVVDRELAGVELLRRRGMELPYRMWGDFTRTVVPQSVLVSEELAGEPITKLMVRFPKEVPAIAEALGSYLRQMHDIEFTNRSALTRMHSLLAPPAGRIPYINPHKNTPWNWEAQDPCGHAQAEALAGLNRAEELGVVPSAEERALALAFQGMAEAMRPLQQSPRFCLVNCHACHFHACHTASCWQIAGVYDFEAVSADDPTNDLVEIEIGLTTALRSFSWREPFARSYGSFVEFTCYKLALLRSLIYYATERVDAKRFGEIIPDILWLSKRWTRLAEAECWDELEWHPLLARD